MTTMKSILSRLTQAVNGTDKELFSEQELNQFASFYLDKWDENTSEDVVAESFVDYWWNTDRACRRCSECGKLMREVIALTWELPTIAARTVCIATSRMRNGLRNVNPTTRVIIQNGNPDVSPDTLGC